EEIRPLKELRRALDRAQRDCDGLQARYAAQAKTKEPSALREDAFQLHEARRAYLKTSLDFSLLTSQFKPALDRLLVDCAAAQYAALRALHEDTLLPLLRRGAPDMHRIQGWLHELDASAAPARREAAAARAQIEDAAEQMTRPSRELEDYAVSTVPYLGTSRGPSFKMEHNHDFAAEKQGWVHLRVVYGKPSRTTWVRRWAFLRNGVFGSLILGSRTGGVEESERIGVLLCSIRPAFQEERRFCFEVKTKNTTIMLQAETQRDLTDWIGCFEAAKRKCLESPHPGVRHHHVQDPAFSISQSPAPEFAAEAFEALTAHGGGPDDAEREGKPSLDGFARPASTELPRRTISLERDRERDIDGGGRDHASRLMQKLDIHRKTSTHAPAQSSIASLISASQSILPISITGDPAAGASGSSTDAARPPRTSLMLPGEAPSSSLAPATLVAPPVATSMSRAAVVVSAEHGIGLKAADGLGEIPQGMLANVWGSAAGPALNNRFERASHPSQVASDGDGDGEAAAATSPPRPLSPPASADRLLQPAPNGTTTPSRTKPTPGGAKSGHRQTMSLSSNLQAFEDVPAEEFDYPSYYPPALRTQDAQFRLLFPSAPKDDTLLLVFQASFCPNDNQDFPGRCYITTECFYFYSNHLGMILTGCTTLSSLSEVTAAPGRECDFLYLHLQPQSFSDVPGRMTLKVFLEPMRLLEARMNFIIGIANAAELPPLESVFSTLTALESKVAGGAPAAAPKPDAWGNAPLLPTDPSPSPQTTSRHADPSAQQPNSARLGTYVDSSMLAPTRQTVKETPVFRLPTQPVHYVPRGEHKLAAERGYSISAKVLFHVLFGDRSIVWHRLRHQQGARDIWQGPWTMHGHSKRLRREFTFTVTSVNMRGQPVTVTVADYQHIDVMNDHLCYVVTDKKIPWQFSLHHSFRQVNKIVLTHVAKARCKLAVYTTLEWERRPYLIAHRIEECAMQDMKAASAQLMDIVTKEVRKLETQTNQMKKAVAIFGNIGHKREGIKFPAPGPLDPDQGGECSPPLRSVAGLVYEAVSEKLDAAAIAVSSRTARAAAVCSKVVSAHQVLLLFLVASVVLNVLHAYHHSMHWWQGRAAATFMNRVGVPALHAPGKAVYIKDIEAVVAPSNAWPRAGELANST
ncbi:SNF1-interacting protein, partial [Ascosphaera acerosa]